MSLGHNIIGPEKKQSRRFLAAKCRSYLRSSTGIAWQVRQSTGAWTPQSDPSELQGLSCKYGMINAPRRQGTQSHHMSPRFQHRDSACRAYVYARVQRGPRGCTPQDVGDCRYIRKEAHLYL